MAARKKSKTGFGRWMSMAGLLAAGVICGYAWRSYAPLPIPGNSRLSGESFAEVSSSDLQKRLASYSSQLDEARSEAGKLREKLRKVEEVQERAEEDLAEIQIKNMLGSGR